MDQISLHAENGSETPILVCCHFIKWIKRNSCHLHLWEQNIVRGGGGVVLITRAPPPSSSHGPGATFGGLMEKHQPGMLS
jgi:hypothetical protein